MFHIEYSKIYSTTEEKEEVKDHDPFASAHSAVLLKTVDCIKKKVVEDNDIFQMAEHCSIHILSIQMTNIEVKTYFVL